MARIISSSKQTNNSNIERRREVAGKKNRAEQELSIGLEKKKYLDSYFTSLNNAPTFIGTYYSTDVANSTFSENINMNRPVDALSFNKIENFVAWGVKNREEIQEGQSDERETYIEAVDQELIVLQGTIKPVAGDYFVLYSQERHALLYKVTNVKTANIVDKPVYQITISIGTITIEELESAVVSDNDFIFSNIGTQKKTVILKKFNKRIKEINEILISLNKMYVDAFYDEMYDALRYPAEINKLPVFFMCRALREFQEDKQVLTYGYNMNTLFSTYPFVTKNDEKDYRRSYIFDIIGTEERKTRRQRIVEPDEETENRPETEKMPTTGLLDGYYPLLFNPYLSSKYKPVGYMTEEMIKNTIKANDYNLEDLTDKDYADIVDYEPKNRIKVKFYANVKSDISGEFALLSHFRLTKMSLIELNSIKGEGKEYISDYELDSNIFKFIIDRWKEKDYDTLINTKLLDRYTVNNTNVDDFLVLPCIMYIMEQAIQMIEKDDVVVSF